MIRRLGLVVAASACLSAVAHAQNAPVRAPAGCTYETCALRVEPAFLAAPRLLRGHEAVEVGSLGAFGGGVDTLLAGPDSAAVHARRYVRSIRAANSLALLSAVAFVVVATRTDWFRNNANGGDVALGITGTALGLISIPFRIHAERSLSRAVWFYNAQFAR